MTTTDESTQALGLLRRRWPEIVLLGGSIFFALAVLLGTYLDDRIVLLGPVDAYVLDILLAEAAVWCVTAFLIGNVVKVARARRIWPGARDTLAVVIMLGALGPSLLIAVVVSLNLGVDAQHELDTPTGSPQYIVSSPFVLGDAKLVLYRGNGIVYERLNLSLPNPDPYAPFATNFRVETDPTGQSLLIYPQGPGEEARIPLPLN